MNRIFFTYFCDEKRYSPSINFYMSIYTMHITLSPSLYWWHYDASSTLLSKTPEICCMNNGLVDKESSFLKLLLSLLHLDCIIMSKLYAKNLEKKLFKKKVRYSGGGFISREDILVIFRTSNTEGLVWQLSAIPRHTIHVIQCRE